MRSRTAAVVGSALLAAAAPFALPRPLAAHDPPAAAAPAPRLTATPSLGVIRRAPDFALPDASGRVVRLSDLRGEVVLVSFIYTQCTAACPVLSRRMALLQQRLRRAGLRARFVSITIDPERDTAGALERYAAGVGADRTRWHFLRDEPSRLAPVLAAWDEWARRERDGGIDHPARLHLVDARGDVREIYALAFFDERQAELDIRALLREPVTR
jgi:protein SCO1/2